MDRITECRAQFTLKDVKQSMQSSGMTFPCSFSRRQANDYPLGLAGKKSRVARIRVVSTLKAI